MQGKEGTVSEQIYKPSLGATAKQTAFTVVSAQSDPVAHTATALNVLKHSARLIADSAYALLMITIVGAHPIWVALLIVSVYSN